MGAMRAKGLKDATTAEEWARAYILSTSLSEKLNPPTYPNVLRPGSPERITAPGRPEELVQAKKSIKSPRSCRTPAQRAKALHSFLHHELQAAELMCWAFLAFPNAPEEFRRGLLRIVQDEVRHARLYADHIERLGFRYGDHPVRDWFWDRVPACETPLQFVACMGIGFEGGNLEHSARFAAAFREHGDEKGAAIQDQVGVEEIAHVRFAVFWFKKFAGDLHFDAWLKTLPPQLSPMVMRGRPLHHERRAAAGLDASFLGALEAWSPSP